MSAHPFHVAGGSFTAKPKIADTLAGLMPFSPSTAALPQVSKGSLRRKLWEIPHKFHCPIIGTCFDVGDLRSLMKKVMHFPADTSDFVLHTTAVSTCETRSRLAELLHKTLEKRCQLAIKRFAAVKTSEGIRELWQMSVQSGSDIPGALWAVWSHPACDSLLEQDIYGDIHMLQHQVGTGARADLTALKSVRNENAELHRLLAQSRRETEAARHEKAQEIRLLNERVTELRAGQVGRDACIARLSAQLDQLRSSLPELKERQALARRADDAEARATALTAHCRAQQGEIERLHSHLRLAEESMAKRAPDKLPEAADGGLPGLAEIEALDGKCVLCVGGRSGSIDAYRQIIEQRGGRFLHHDGGLEESIHRIDGFLAAADLVICQAGCISHNAYWRVKEQCKRSGKPCLYMKSGGASGLSRLIDQNRAEAALPAAEI